MPNTSSRPQNDIAQNSSVAPPHPGGEQRAQAQEVAPGDGAARLLVHRALGEHPDREREQHDRRGGADDVDPAPAAAGQQGGTQQRGEQGACGVPGHHDADVAGPAFRRGEVGDVGRHRRQHDAQPDADGEAGGPEQGEGRRDRAHEHAEGEQARAADAAAAGCRPGGSWPRRSRHRAASRWPPARRRCRRRPCRRRSRGRRAGTGRSRRSRRGRSPRARRSRPRGPGRGARWRVRVGRSSRGSCRRWRG